MERRVEPTSYSDPKTLGSLQHLKLSTQMVLDSLKKGQHLNPRAGYSIEFSQHREYAAGDDLRHLDWKAYARTDRLYVKQFQDETSLCCYLAVDNSLSMSFQGPIVLQQISLLSIQGQLHFEIGRSAR